MKPLPWWKQAVSGWVFPPVCAGCEVVLTVDRQLASPFLCLDCEGRLPGLEGIACQVCGQHYEMPAGVPFRCSNCHDREVGFDFALSAARNSGLARDLVHRFKYGKQIHLSRLMASLLDRVWSDERLHSRDHWIVIPVPLHAKRMRERGFNQAAETAKDWVRHQTSDLELTYCSLLKRPKSTVRQAQLDREERLLNPQGVFSIQKDKLAKLRKRERGPLGAMIVDDVMTTGATVSECAVILRETGEFEEIVGVSVMRG